MAKEMKVLISSMFYIEINIFFVLNENWEMKKPFSLMLWYSFKQQWIRVNQVTLARREKKDTKSYFLPKVSDSFLSLFFNSKGNFS